MTETDFSVIDIIIDDLPAQPSAVAVVEGLRKIPVVECLYWDG